MKEKILTIEDITTRLKPVFEQNGVTKAILFGSYAKGTATEDSDVDIAVETEPFVRGFMFGGIYNAIIKKLQKKVDIVLQTGLDKNERIYSEISKNGMVIYER